MKIKVGYVDYTVEPMGAVTRSVEPDTYGICDATTKTIYIRDKDLPAVQGSSLIHELLHALFDIFTLPKSGLSEEDVCTKLEVPLAVLFRDNPGLPTVLRDALCRGKAIFKEPS